MDNETSKPDLTRVLPIVEERASLHSVSKPDVRDELNSLFSFSVYTNSHDSLNSGYEVINQPFHRNMIGVSSQPRIANATLPEDMGLP